MRFVAARLNLFPIAILLFLPWSLSGESGVTMHGTVVDASGASIPDAQILVYSVHGTLLRQTLSNSEGKFEITSLARGSYAMRVAAGKFQPRTLSMEVTHKSASPLVIMLEVAGGHTDITVSARRAGVEMASGSASFVSVWDRSQLFAGPGADVRDALQGRPGVMVQETTPGQVSPYLRGLTGYQTLILVDEVRFNTSTFRSGPNQYLGLIDASQIERVEAVLGPTGSTFGSDSLGGTIHVFTRQLHPRGNLGPAFHGEGGTFVNGADLGGGADAQISRTGGRIDWLLGASGRRFNDLRAGGGEDSHNVFARFVGLSPGEVRSLLGDRLQDTGYSQKGFHARLTAYLPGEQSLSGWFQYGSLGGIRSYRELLGGTGRLQALFEPQRLNLFYVRYENLRLGILDSVSSTFSMNSQRDNSIRQGPNLTDVVTSDQNRVDALGWTLQGTAHFGTSHALAAGFEAYRENLDSIRFETNPVSGQTSQKRALYPDGSRYTMLSLFGEGSSDIVKRKLRASLGGRLTVVRSEIFAARNADPAGAGFGVLDSSRRFRDFTFHAGLSWNVASDFVMVALIRRGFRAPNMNDLGAVGYSGTGFEVPADSAVDKGALLSVDASESAMPTGRPVSPLQPETLVSYELGFRMGGPKAYGRVHFFDSELSRPIVRRTLLFPANDVPEMLAGVPVVPIAPTAEQKAAGVIAVASPYDPRAVKAFVNEGKTRYYGVEAFGRVPMGLRWSLEGSYTYIIGRDLNPNRPVRRLPPQQWAGRLRYAGSGRKPWLELQAVITGMQDRLSAGDLDDERIGASRSRSNIRSFLRSGPAAGYLGPGQDGKAGTTDDVFMPTGETVAQVMDRVLPIGAVINGVTVTGDSSRVPMFVTSPGWFCLNLVGGMHFSERWGFNFGVANLLDRNYRIYGSGADAPGISVSAGLRYHF
ncbi:MAG: TonB-dependent receptor [Acidobacteria bacterium]|nr:TonB-dependent receptor [Acidobacteriota bacterium]